MSPPDRRIYFPEPQIHERFPSPRLPVTWAVWDERENIPGTTIALCTDTPCVNSYGIIIKNKDGLSQKYMGLWVKAEKLSHEEATWWMIEHLTRFHHLENITEESLHDHSLFIHVSKLVWDDLYP